ncbi:bactofilin family protein [Natronorarus salvus]|uniref:bactofilin family protein n=1 Tax=Natronorarus salvus TaxID=3117733 RepID=UPI002F268469
MRITISRHVLVFLVVGALVLGLIPGIAAAQTGASGTVIVEEGETVSEVNAVAGAILVQGTVTGDVSGAAGNVLIEGTVEGDVSTATGNLRITGAVDGDVAAGAGDIHIDEGATIGGDLDAGAGTIRIDGAIGGDVTIGADTIQLGDEAEIAGSLTYDGTLEGNLDAVAGEITRDRTIGVSIGPDLQPLASWVFTVYAFVLNLLLGAVLLALFPRFSEDVADRVSTEPVKTGLVGLGLFIAVPLVLVLVALTVIGIPLSIGGAIAFAFLLWIGVVYGRFAIGAWLLSLAGMDNLWLALVGGLLVGAVLSQVPFIGGLLNVVILLLGLGALATGLYEYRRRSRPSSAPAPLGETPADELS